MTFYVGQKVVCIDDDFTHPLIGYIRQLPSKGAVYHVRGFAPEIGDIFARDGSYIWLSEISNPVTPPEHEASFHVDCFRPVAERKTDISIFTAMLNPKQRELVPHDGPDTLTHPAQSFGDDVPLARVEGSLGRSCGLNGRVA